MDPTNDHNPYAPPRTPVSDFVTQAQPDALTAQVAFGQKRIIWAILLQLGGIALGALSAVVGTANASVDVVDFVIGIAALGLAISGLMKTARGLRIRPVIRGLLVVCLLLPIINLITLVILNFRATSKLRQAGYRVGFLGVTSG
jgi:hypothetical protein